MPDIEQPSGNHRVDYAVISDGMSQVAYEQDTISQQRGGADRSIGEGCRLSAEIGQLILASLYDKNRVCVEDATCPKMAVAAADQLLQSILGIVAAVSQLKQPQHKGGRFFLSDGGVFIEPFRKELMAQVCIGAPYKNEIFERLHAELRSCLWHPGASGRQWKLMFYEDRYVVELSK